MNSVLHGTWVMDAAAQEDEFLFVWAEHALFGPQPSGRMPRIRRHPYAATAIEVAALLATHVPQADWGGLERLTRVALLPSTARAPIVPHWLNGGDEQLSDDEQPQLHPWRIEGLRLPASRILDLLASLPRSDRELQTTQRMGEDLRFWSLAAKFALELLARQRFLPGLRAEGDAVRAVWIPVLDDPRDQQRTMALARGMPPVCRALFGEELARHGSVPLKNAPRAAEALQSFVGQVVDHAVREWGEHALRGLPVPYPQHPASALTAGSDPARQVSAAWWQALWSPESVVALSPGRQQELTRFYQAWQGWTCRSQPAADSSFRLCFRLEPPEGDGGSPDWALRYFLQATDDPSLLVPAHDVWRERGNVLSYLAHRFDHPQEKLLAGLGVAARLSPAIQRSLKVECPEVTALTAQEAFSFLRETARLLEGLGFGVMVPPWWNKPDARLSVRVRLHGGSEGTRSGILSMDSVISYDWELALGDESLTREEFEQLAELKAPLVQVRGRWVLLQPDQIEAAIAFWERQQARSELALRDALGLALNAKTEVDGLAVGEVEADGWLAELLGRLGQGDQLLTLETPGGFVGQLRPYQERGFSWLAFLGRWGLGACLADDMGLGKTIQAIALLLHEREQRRQVGSGVGPGTALLICPTSLVGNWHREVGRFAPDLRVLIHHGSGRAEGADFLEQSIQHDLVISSYGLARRDIDDLIQIHWSSIILDEAQNIKNPVTKQARAIRRLKGGHRITLTGTPIENRLSELWSIMAFLHPGYLGSLESFRHAFVLPIERFQDQEASERLRRLVRPFILRRLKTDPRVIRDLPEKFEYKVYCNLTREQATLYEAVVRAAMAGLLTSRGEQEGIRRRGQVLAMLTRLKQVCDHPALFLGDGSETPRRSGKLNRLCEMLEEVLAVGDRALIFTQYAQMGHLLQRHLQDTFAQEVLFLHGGTPQKQRDRMLTRFEEDPHAPGIFVLSLKAGGTGLNLMRANHVFHYDRWWNPAVENQATDRAYRIGQARDVQVQKLVCLGTVEERIDALIESKRALAESVIGAGEAWLTELSTDDLREIVALRADAVEME